MTTLPLASPWLLSFKLVPRARLRLFCFPYAGGGAAAFRSWAGGLPSPVELCAVELPGRGSRLREKPFVRLNSLADALAQALLPHLDRPFAFFGHSMGALLSFEVARRLRREQGPRPQALYVSGSRAPRLPAAHAPLHQLPDPLFVQELRRLNGTPEAVLGDPSLMRLFLPFLRADFAACETHVYTYDEPLDCSIVAFGGLSDPRVSKEDLAAWREETSGQFTLRLLPGDHFFLQSAQAQLLEALAEDLSQAAAVRNSP